MHPKKKILENTRNTLTFAIPSTWAYGEERLPRRGAKIKLKILKGGTDSLPVITEACQMEDREER